MPELFLLLAAMALLMVGVFQKDDEAGPARVACSRLVGRLSVLVPAAALLLVVTIGGGEGRVTTFGEMFVVDHFAVFFKVLILISSALTILIAQDYLEVHRIARFEFPVLILLATVGMMLMVSANDLISLYLGLEMQSLALYVVASFQRDDMRSVEAGLKYFVLSALASGMLLYGSSLVYGFSGTTSFDVLAQVLATAPGDGVAAGRADRHRLHPRRPRLQGLGGAVPHVDARTSTRARRRRSPRSSRWRRSWPRSACCCG